jgi:hypothetical protein
MRNGLIAVLTTALWVSLSGLPAGATPPPQEPFQPTLKGFDRVYVDASSALPNLEPLPPEPLTSGEAPTTGPTAEADPWTVAEPPIGRGGWSPGAVPIPPAPARHTLVLENETTARSVVSVAGVKIGELLPRETGELLGVRGGRYLVSFTTPEGHTRSRELAATP